MEEIQWNPFGFMDHVNLCQVAVRQVKLNHLYNNVHFELTNYFIKQLSQNDVLCTGSLDVLCTGTVHSTF